MLIYWRWGFCNGEFCPFACPAPSGLPKLTTQRVYAMRTLIITNNILVKEEHKNQEVCYFDISYKEILLKVRDMCYEGHKLLTHPLSGSVKPNETPYKSVMVSKEKQPKPDPESILIMEEAILTYDKFPKLNISWNERILGDFQAVDLALISSALRG